MALSGTYTLTIAAQGLQINGNATRTATMGIDPISDTLAVAKAGTLTGRTGATTGVATMVTGHGIATSSYVDVHWAGGSRYGMLVGTPTGLALPIEGGGGHDLPVTTTPLGVMVPVSYDCTFDGDNLVMIGAGTTRQGRVTFKDSSSTVLFSAHIPAAGAWGWAEDLGSTTPITGNPVHTVEASNGNTSLTSEFSLTGLQY